MKRRLVAGTTVLAVVVAGFLLASPGAVLDELARIAARPLRFGLVLLALAAVRPFLAWPTTLLAVAVGYGYGWPGVPFGLLLVTLTALPPYWLALAGRGNGEGRVAKVGERVVSATGGTRSVAGGVGVSADRGPAGDLSGRDPALLVGMAAAGVLLLAGPLYRGYREHAAA